MMQTETITLGGREFTLKRPTLGQLRPLVDALDRMSQETGGGIIEPAAELIAAGLAPTHPDITADALLDMPITIADLNQAVAAVLKIAGLQPKEPAPGEAPSPDGRPPRAAVPGTSPNSSAIFTPPSPPAPASITARSTG